MKLDIDWKDESQIRNLYNWLTLAGLAPKFGNCTIHHYQNSQHEALDTLELEGFKDCRKVGDDIVDVSGKRLSIRELQSRIADYARNKNKKTSE